MNENIKKIAVVSNVVLAAIVLIWVGYSVATKYLALQTQVNEIISFINNNIAAQSQAAKVPAAK